MLVRQYSASTSEPMCCKQVVLTGPRTIQTSVFLRIPSASDRLDPRILSNMRFRHAPTSPEQHFHGDSSVKPTFCIHCLACTSGALDLESSMNPDISHPQCHTSLYQRDLESKDVVMSHMYVCLPRGLLHPGFGCQHLCSRPKPGVSVWLHLYM